MDFVALIGGAAAVVSVVSFVPQAMKAVLSRDLNGISAKGYTLTTAAFALWLIYGILLRQWPLMLSNAICLALSALILVMKLLRSPNS
jgi:MtN3 and saliva related transmembrane protein